MTHRRPNAKETLARKAAELAAEVRASLSSASRSDRIELRRRLWKQLWDDDRREAAADFGPQRSKRRGTPRRAKRMVLFLGAGASVPHGYPATAALLREIWNALRSDDQSWSRWSGFRYRDRNGRFKPKRENAEELQALLRSILPGLDRADGNFQGASIVDVISMLEHCIAERHTPIASVFVRSGATLNDIRKDARVGKAIEQPARRLIRGRHLLTMAMNGVLQGTKNQRLSAKLAAWLVNRASQSRSHRVSLVSTNYDTVVEAAIYKELRRRQPRRSSAVEENVDFGMTFRDVEGYLRGRRIDAPIAVFKLHGSLNWLRCESCGHVTISTWDRIASLDSWEVQNLHNSCECGGLLKSLLVTPSIVREIRDASLLSIWNAALEDLRLADEWVFVGYSLPAEDVAIRSLLLRAFHARERLDDLRVRVVSYEPVAPDAPPSPQDAFRMFFPEAHFKQDDYDCRGAEQFIQSLESPPGKRRRNASV